MNDVNETERYLRRATRGLWGRRRQAVQQELRGEIEDKVWRHRLGGCTEADGCGCEDGARGTGSNGVDTCADGNDCASSLCVEGADAFYCSDVCSTNEDCGPSLPVCTDIAFLGRVCIREAR